MDSVDNVKRCVARMGPKQRTRRTRACRRLQTSCIGTLLLWLAVAFAPMTVYKSRTAKEIVGGESFCARSGTL